MRNEKLGCQTWSLHKIGPKRNQNVWPVDTLYFVLLAQSSLFVNKIIVFKNNSKKRISLSTTSYFARTQRQ